MTTINPDSNTNIMFKEDTVKTDTIAIALLDLYLGVLQTRP